MINNTLISLHSYFEKLLGLPTLDHTDWNGWENKVEAHEKQLAKQYPIRNFVVNTLFDRVLYPIDRNIQDTYWWVRHHTTNRYHILDLRQPKYLNHFPNSDHYSYGWRDVDTRIVLASFNLLCQFVENELDTIDVSAANLVEHPELKAQYDACTTIKSLYHYWKVERHQLQQQYDQALDEWSALRHSKNKAQAEPVWKELNDLEVKLNDREDEMMMTLVKVRRYLWS